MINNLFEGKPVKLDFSLDITLTKKVDIQPQIFDFDDISKTFTFRNTNPKGL